MATVNSERGTKKLFYGFKIMEVDGGVQGQDGDFSLAGGYFNDPSIAPDSYPNPEDRMVRSVAVQKCEEGVRFFQSLGKDVKGEVWGKIFGKDADDPVYVLGNFEQRFAVIDTPDPKLRRKISLANTPKNVDGDLGDGDDTEDA